MKQCARCNVEKPMSDFYVVKGKTGSMRYDSWCKKCRTEYSKKYAKRKPKGVFIGHDGKLRIYTGSTGYGKMYWTENMLSVLRRYYPNIPNHEVCEMIGLTEKYIVAKARELGLAKSKEFLASAKKRGAKIRGLIKIQQKRDKNGRFCKEDVKEAV